MNGMSPEQMQANLNMMNPEMMKNASNMLAGMSDSQIQMYLAQMGCQVLILKCLDQCAKICQI